MSLPQSRSLSSSTRSTATRASSSSAVSTISLFCHNVGVCSLKLSTPVPCNQFASQDPENDEGIGAFCQRNYGVSFDMMAKSDVNGDKANEVFKFLKAQKSGLLGTSGIKCEWRSRCGTLFATAAETDVRHRRCYQGTSPSSSSTSRERSSSGTRPRRSQPRLRPRSSRSWPLNVMGIPTL